MSVVEWICDCCGSYLLQWDDRIIVGTEDRCEDCTEHDEHCHEWIACECHGPAGWDK